MSIIELFHEGYLNPLIERVAMQQCILEGHKFQDFPGVGEYRGQRFLVCVRCGKTLERNENAQSNDVGGSIVVSLDGELGSVELLPRHDVG